MSIETFLRFHTACVRGEIIAYPKAWLCQVATNAAYKIRRHQHRELLCEEEDTATDAGKDAERRLLVDRVRDLAAELPERQRMVFALGNFEGWPFAEIAARLDPFERPVAITVDFADGWDVALDYLREQFGVAMERVSEPITYEVLVLRPHGKDAR